MTATRGVLQNIKSHCIILHACERRVVVYFVYRVFDLLLAGRSSARGPIMLNGVNPSSLHVCFPKPKKILA